MVNDAFSKRHPLVNFVFFLGAIGVGAVVQHPAYLAAGVVCGAVYCALLLGRRGFKLFGAAAALFVVLTLLNPLFNTYGQRILFHLFGRPYTLEALYYGAACGAVLTVMLMWFACYSAVLTSDKFTSLFGNFIPALSLLLVMVLRLIPNLMRKAAQFIDARRSIGKGAQEGQSNRQKIRDGMTVLSALTDWALEGSIVTGDSMRSRGYGSGRRTSFMIYRLAGADIALLGLELSLLAAVIWALAAGAAQASYTPELIITPLAGANALGFGAYLIFLLIPTVLHIQEVLQWHISRSGI